ncbi:MAG TPA: endonuclease VIII [Clostridiales bacterium]|nr:endonuclease VIII [Clostridiales bacterium]
MIELPEAVALSRQIQETILGKKIVSVKVAVSPHKFAWYYKDPQMYEQIILNKTITESKSYGGFVEIQVENTVLLFNDGVGLRYHSELDPKPMRHQLLVEFDDGSALSASVQMYGGLWCYKKGDFHNDYLTVAQEKPSPLSLDFDRSYFDNILSNDNQKLSLKALLATEQRIPGLGNGVLQDVLFNAGLHPKRKTNTLKKSECDKLYNSLKGTIYQMTQMGGRDTEKDLFGFYGGYGTKLSKNTVDTPCVICGTIIKREAYMGGSIYYCGGCQPL